MNRIQRNLWLAATILFSVCLVILTFSYLVTEPWRMLPDIGGDGAKNNFTYLYHSIYGKGYWFEGMNYPYGEHIVFTDGQPLLSVLFAALGNTSVATALTVTWWLLGFSYILAIVYIYKTLLYFKVSPLPALLFSGFIGICTPQLMCIRGHYALAYTCVVPMIFYWNILYHESGKLRYCLWFFIAGCIVSFLHPYYAAMMLVWAGAYGVGYFIFTRAGFAAKLKHTTLLLASVIGVLLVIAVTMKLTDPATDRPSTPYNPMEANTHLRQIFTSAYSPFWLQAEKRNLITKVSDGGEGFTYPGGVTIAAVILFLGLVLARKITNREHGVELRSSGFSPVWLFIAFSVLALSMGIPFIWNMKWLMNYISFFKQFRALGRFSWIFYYIITVYGAVIVYALYSRLMAKRAVAGYAFLVLVMLVWSVETSGYMRMARKVSRDAAYNYDMIFSTYEQKWVSWLGDHHLSPGDFQAILVLKFYHIGSEKLWVGDGSWSNTLATKAGLQLHLPIVDVMMSRSSWSQTKTQLKIAAGPYADKPMLRDIKSNKPFLLMEYDLDSLLPDEAYLLQSSDLIGGFSSCRVYACYPDRILANDKKHAARINEILPYIAVGDSCIDSGGTWYAEHYDSRGGIIPCIKGDDSIIATIPVTAVADSEMYEYSCWFQLDTKDYRSPQVELVLQDNAGKLLTAVKVNTAESMDSYDMWFRASKYFYMPRNCSKVVCRLINTPNQAYLYMDNTMLRPAKSTIVSKGKDGIVMVNNHMFKTTK